MRLSVSRFQHVFKAQVGTTFRRYRLWGKMHRVARSLQQGHALTRAAMDGGFASSSHLSAAFRDMFGVAPSVLLGHGATFVTDPTA